jgi:hypothetical protein
VNIRARQSENPAAGDIDLFIWAEKDGKIFGVKFQVDWENEKNPAVAGESLGEAATISKETAQTLLDDLYAAGMRPSKGRDVTGDLKAKDAHILFAERTVEALIKCLPQSQRTS